MHDLNDALDELRHVIPYAHSPSVRKLSKIATLLLAKNFILMQANALQEMRRMLVCLHQHCGPNLSQSLSASVAAIIGSSSALALPHGVAKQHQHQQQLDCWSQGGATANGPAGQSQAGKQQQQNCPGSSDDTSQKLPAAGGVQSRRRKYNMLINRILSDVASHQLAPPPFAGTPLVQQQQQHPKPIDFCTTPASALPQATMLTGKQLYHANQNQRPPEQAVERRFNQSVHKRARYNCEPSNCATGGDGGGGGGQLQPAAGSCAGIAQQVPLVVSRPPRSATSSCSSLVSVGSPTASAMERAETQSEIIDNVDVDSNGRQQASDSRNGHMRPAEGHEDSDGSDCTIVSGDCCPRSEPATAE